MPSLRGGYPGGEDSGAAPRASAYAERFINTLGTRTESAVGRLVGAVRARSVLAALMAPAAWRVRSLALLARRSRFDRSL